MGEVLAYSPKALVDFEKSALRLVTNASSFMRDYPAAIRVAKRLKDEAFIETMSALIIPLSALSEAIGLMEASSEGLVADLEEEEPVVIHIQNAGGTHDVSCHAMVRKNVIYVSLIDVRSSNWLARLTQEEPKLRIERMTG